MSKSKGSPPNVELRRRNSKPYGTTPAEELKEVLESPVSVKTPPVENGLRDGAPMETDDGGVVSEQPDDSFEIGGCRPVAPADGPTTAVQEPVRNELYRPKNLVLIATRLAGGLSAQMRESIKSTLELFPHVIEGAARGFAINLDSKAAYEPTTSCLRMTFDERAGRAIGKLFESWGREIGRVGVGAHTTVDFLLIEPDADGRRVLDAWNCRSMFPAAMATSHGGRFLHGTRDCASLSTTWNGNVQLMEDVAQAQTAFDALCLASANPYQPS